MSLIGIIVVLIVVGIILWAIQALPVIDPTVKRLIQVLVILIVALWAITNIFPGILDVRIN